MTSCAWLWLYAGLFLMLAEILAPGFVIFFFGLAAMSVGGLRFAFGEAFTPTWQLAAFSAFSILYLVVLRRYMRKAVLGEQEGTQTDFNNECVGRVGQVTTALEPPKTGRVMVGEGEGTACAEGAISAGTDVRVVARENLTMKVEPL